MVPPLSKQHIDAFVDAGPIPEEEVERRVQEALNQWVGRYFTGDPVDVVGPNASTVQKTFDRVDRHWGMIDPGEDLTRPILHGLLADRSDSQPDRVADGVDEISGRWTFSFLIRTPHQFTAPDAVPNDSAVEESDRINRRVADQLAWLLRSPQVQALALCGIHRVRVTSGPTTISAGAWHLRSITVTANPRWRILNGEP